MTPSLNHGHGHGQVLEVTVVGCNISSGSNCVSLSHDPLYVCFQYAGKTYITIPSQDGGMNGTFSNKFYFPVIEGQSELKFVVWKNIPTNFIYDDFMGSGRVQLQNVVSQGSDELSCPFHKGNDRHLAGGELQLVLNCTTQSKNNLSTLEKSPTQNYPQYPYASHNFSTNPTLSYWPPLFYHHSPPPYHLLSPPPYPPPYPPSLPHYLPPAYPSPPPHQYYPPYLYAPPPPPYYPPQYQVPSSQLPPPPTSSLASLLLPLQMVSYVASIGSSMFQFFEE